MGKRGPQVNPALLQAVQLVREGASYGDAAAKLGLTRGAVAGGCSRAGLKVPLEGDRLRRFGVKVGAIQREHWASLRKNERQRRVALIVNSGRRFWDGLSKAEKRRITKPGRDASMIARGHSAPP
jgi:hypothetical protein